MKKKKHPWSQQNSKVGPQHYFILLLLRSWGVVATIMSSALTFWLGGCISTIPKNKKNKIKERGKRKESGCISFVVPTHILQKRLIKYIVNLLTNSHATLPLMLCWNLCFLIGGTSSSNYQTGQSTIFSVKQTSALHKLLTSIKYTSQVVNYILYTYLPPVVVNLLAFDFDKA